jgi:dienelactone hydrolase
MTKFLQFTAGILVALTLVTIFWLRDVIFVDEPALSEWTVQLEPHVYTRVLGEEPRPVVFLLHGCGGQKPWLREQRLERYSQWGYFAVAIDSFGARDVEPKRVCEGTQLWAGQRLVDLAAALEIVSSNPLADTSQYAVVGFSHGAWAALETYSDSWDEYETMVGAPSAVVAYYPFCEWPNRAAASWKRNTPLLSLLGELDSITAVTPCLELFNRNALTTVIRHVVYPGAEHGFDVLDTEEWTDHYNEDADVSAQREVKQFLDSQFSQGRSN